ncbi:MAG TPA: hypothetical protein ENK91_02970 [Bacteroidetes bacterium]|nr:hypothetical protein [Bacteroidota bacterium]
MNKILSRTQVFSLEGALQLFKESQSPEEFEKKLNSEDSYVNNLDLNEDGKIDYIKVIDNAEGDAHAIVLQVDLNEKESQDIAVIEMEKTAANTVAIQIVGNEDLFVEDTYVEPVPEASSQNVDNTTVVNTTVVNVWGWPSVRYVYGPRYRVWVSPWRWGYYPVYWRPWRPYPWRYYHSKTVRFHVYFHPVRVHRVHRAHRIYIPKRRTSVTVHKRSNSIRINRNKKVVKSKTSTTKVGIKKQNGKVVAGKKTTTTTKKRNKHGTTVKKTTKKTTVKKNKNKTKVKRTKTTTKKRRKR